MGRARRGHHRVRYRGGAIPVAPGIAPDSFARWRGFGIPLPEFNENGDLPVDVYPASIDEVVARFGGGSVQRQEVTQRLQRLWQLATGTGSLDRMVVFGSYVTAKPSPKDVDVVLVMADDFRLVDCPPESRVLFDHARADVECGASVFWIRPSMLIGETLEHFVAHWQRKRDGQLRGIVEITP